MGRPAWWSLWGALWWFFPWPLRSCTWQGGPSYDRQDRCEVLELAAALCCSSVGRQASLAPTGIARRSKGEGSAGSQFHGLRCAGMSENLQGGCAQQEGVLGMLFIGPGARTSSSVRWFRPVTAGSVNGR